MSCNIRNSQSKNHNYMSERLLPYKIISTILEDSQTITYLSQNELLGQKVVLKCLKNDFLQDKAVCDYFKVQAQTQARHTHANLPVLYDLIEKQNALFTVSEYIEGENLQIYLSKNGAMTEENATTAFSEILDVLDFSEQNNLNLKNISIIDIIVTAEKNIKISPKNGLFNENSTNNPKPNIKKDTKEKINNAGKILYEMVVGNLPNAKNGTDFPAPKKEKKSVSERMNAILVQAVSKNTPTKSYNEFKKTLTQDVNVESLVIAQSFTALPLIIFLGLLGLVASLLSLVNADRTLKTNITYDLYNEAFLQKRLDSLQQIKVLKIKSDSLEMVNSQKKDSTYIYVHKVKAGESLQSLAARYNMSEAHFKNMNNFEDKKSTFREGLGVRVLVRTVHKVLKKEKLDDIAKLYAVTRLELIRTNNIRSENLDVYEGKELLIPLKK